MEEEEEEEEDFLSVFNLLAQYSVFLFSVHSDLWQEETRLQGPGAKELSLGRCRKDLIRSELRAPTRRTRRR